VVVHKGVEIESAVLSSGPSGSALSSYPLLRRVIILIIPMTMSMYSSVSRQVGKPFFPEKCTFLPTPQETDGNNDFNVLDCELNNF
jgi:hypothetical protein